MKTYDFSKGNRGPLVKTPEGKEKITIRLDHDVLDWFRDQVDAAGGGNYQTLINQTLRDHITGKLPVAPALERVLRRVIREELKRPVGTVTP
jgi:hypothetical protein